MRSFLFVLPLLACASCRSPHYADRGAMFGAITGALAGAAIGEHNGDAGAGAAIGTAVGSLAGTAIGESIDHEVAQSQALIEARLGRRLAGAVAVNDVIAMTQADLSESVIATHIRANGVAQPPTVDDLITMRNAGVQDSVIQVMQTAPPPVDPAPIPPAGPVVVEEHHYFEPGPWQPRFRRRPPWFRRRDGPGVHWGISVGN